MTYSNSKRQKIDIQNSLTTLQWNKRWYMLSMLFLYMQHQFVTITHLFLRYKKLKSSITSLSKHKTPFSKELYFLGCYSKEMESQWRAKCMIKIFYIKHLLFGRDPTYFILASSQLEIIKMIKEQSDQLYLPIMC